MVAGGSGMPAAIHLVMINLHSTSLRVNLHYLLTKILLKRKLKLSFIMIKDSIRPSVHKSVLHLVLLSDTL